MNTKHHIYSFEKLEVYKNALLYSVEIRDVVSYFPKSEEYKLTRQLEKSVDSISSNLAEGSGRASNNDQAHFTNMAFGSALESINHLNLALLLKYIKEDRYTQLRLDMDKIINQLNALYRYQVNNSQTLKTKVKAKP